MGMNSVGMGRLSILLLLVILSLLRAEEVYKEQSPVTYLDWYDGLIVEACNNKQPNLGDCISSCDRSTECECWAYQHITGCCFMWNKRKNVGDWDWVRVTYGSREGGVEGSTL